MVVDYIVRECSLSLQRAWSKLAGGVNGSKKSAPDIEENPAQLSRYMLGDLKQGYRGQWIIKTGHILNRPGVPPLRYEPPP